MVLILISALVMMLSVGVKTNGSKVSCAFSCLDKYNLTTVTRTVSPSQFLDCSGNKCLSTLGGSLEGLLHILIINKKSQAELIEAGKEIQSNKIPY